jgi:hypothetical protein
MKRKYFITLIVILAIPIIAIKIHSYKSNESSSLSENFLKSKGYEIILNKGKVEAYKLTNEKLNQLPYSYIWKIQNIDINKYIGDNIDVYEYIVKNHPLDKLPENKNKDTKVWIIEANNKIIGGYSFPNSEAYVSPVFPLDGH